MKALTTFEIIVPVYNYRIDFLVNCSFGDMLAEALRHRIIVTDTRVSDGCVIQGSETTLVWISDLSLVDIIAHEIAHAAFYVCDKAEIKPSFESQEGFTYLVGYITRAFHEKIESLTAKAKVLKKRSKTSRQRRKRPVIQDLP